MAGIWEGFTISPHHYALLFSLIPLCTSIAFLSPLIDYVEHCGIKVCGLCTLFLHVCM